MSNKVSGRVKWFNNAKGFGFIEQEAGPDIFAHYSSIHSSSTFKTLLEGQEVQFKLVEGPKGLLAEEIEATS